MLDIALLARVPTDRRHLVGVSGGRDSVALLHLLREAGYAGLVVCHLDHGLRGEAGAEEARFVAGLAGRLGYRCALGQEDVAALARRARISVETAGRRARLDFFRRTAAAEGCATVFLAHHADDRVETFLLNLFRGAGPGGLCSPRAEARHGDLVLLRPLLGVGREAIDAYVRRAGLEYREDATNASDLHARNRLRNEIIPGIERAMGRRIGPGILRLMEIIEGEERWVERVVEGRAAVERLDVGELRLWPEGLQRRVIRRWLQLRGVPGIGFREVESVRALVEEGAARARANLPGERWARRRAGRIWVEGRTPGPGSPDRASPAPPPPVA